MTQGGQASAHQPAEDLLGPGFLRLTLDVPGRGAHTTAVLVRHVPEEDPGFAAPDDPADGDGPAGPRGTVIYVHGWSDYFSNPQLARAVSAAGYRFFALDMHGYGRNLTDDVLSGPGVPGYAEDFEEYVADFEAAIAAVRRVQGPEEPDGIVWVGHSTGGLVLSLAVLRGDLAPAGLALATPWIAPHLHDAVDPLTAAVLGLVPQRWRSRSFSSQLTGNYFRSLSSAHHGEWDLDERWRPGTSFPVTAGFLLAGARERLELRRRHRAGARVTAPVLLQTARRTLIWPWWLDVMMRRDTVLDVRQIRRRAGVLSPQPRVISYDGGLHDVHRSLEPVRSRALGDLQEWLREVAAQR